MTAKPLAPHQVEVLRWVGDGCTGRDWPDESHKLTARALAARGLLKVTRKNKVWGAELTVDGRHYLDTGEHPDRTDAEPVGGSAEVSAADKTRLAIRARTTAGDRRGLQTARRRRSRGGNALAAGPLKEIHMRYKIIVSRVQTAERYVRATTEDDAIRKVREELERPYGFLGGWTTLHTDLDVVAAESPLDETNANHVNQQDGGFLLSIKAAAKHLGISYRTLYELINRGEIAHVMIGSRRYVSREQLNDFISANTHTGYHAR